MIHLYYLSIFINIINFIATSIYAGMKIFLLL